MSEVARNLDAVRSAIPEGVELVAVSKFHPADALLDAYGAGQRIFGESRARELVDKAAELPADIRWHFIGHLQTNKVRAIIPVVSLIHSIDSERLLATVSDEAQRIGRTVPILFQIHVAQEETKFGFTPDELMELMDSGVAARFPGIIPAGVMGMASNVDDTDRIRRDFREIRRTFDSLAAGAMAGVESFRTVSMGMSHDWRIAADEGSNMVRIGTAIFGERQY